MLVFTIAKGGLMYAAALAGQTLQLHAARPALTADRHPGDGPPRAICLIRLSAIGDTCHTVPMVRAVQRTWPECRITWIIGRIEAKLMALLPDVEFLTVDKGRAAAEFGRLRPRTGGASLRCAASHAGQPASESAEHPGARSRQGGIRPRETRELQWLFTNRQIAPRRREHVLDSFWGFTEALGITERRLEWNLPLPPDAVEYAAQVIAADGRPMLLISACSSHVLRNWRAEYYARVADHAADRWGMSVVLCGGPSAIERDMGSAYRGARRAPLGSDRPGYAAPDAGAARRRDRAADPRSGPGAHGRHGGDAGDRICMRPPIRPEAVLI